MPTEQTRKWSVKSVRKKWKQKGFATGANRDVIEKGAAMLGVEKDALIADVIAGMREVATGIGLGIVFRPEAQRT